MSEVSESPSLAARIEKLEAQAAGFKRLAIVACAALVGVTAIGASAVAGAHAPFTVVDSAGRTRIRLDAGGMHVLDANGKERITVGFNAKGQPVVHLNDKAGSTRESLYLSPSQAPGLQQYDAQGNTRSTYDLASAGPQIEFEGAEGIDRFYVVGSNTPFERFGDAARAERAYFGLTSEGDGLVRLIDKQGKDAISIEGQPQPFMRLSEAGTERVFLGLGTSDDGLLTMEDSSARDQVEVQGGTGPYVRLTDGSQTKRAYMGVYSDGTSGLSIWDSAGTLHWYSP